MELAAKSLKAVNKKDENKKKLL